MRYSNLANPLGGLGCLVQMGMNMLLNAELFHQVHFFSVSSGNGIIHVKNYMEMELELELTFDSLIEIH